MTVGNQIGVKLANGITVDDLFVPSYGSFIIELADNAKVPAVSNLVEVSEVGKTTEAYQFVAAGETLDLAELQDAWEGGIESVFPYRSKGEDKGATVETIDFHAPKKTVYVGSSVAKPHVVIPVFPGNNCEYDSAAAFERAGADVTTLIVNNLTPAAVAESTQALVDEINKSQIVMIPGGFSGGDEPDGSAKFITAFFRAPAVTEAVRDLLKNRDGLMLGICNGFQALVKLGLVPYGDIVPMTDACPTLTFNTIGRHQSRLVRTRVASDLSPWLSKTSVGDIHTVAISHGEGRFVASDEDARPAQGQRPDRHAVRGRDRHPRHGPGCEPERLAARHRGHHQPGRPRVRQDGPLRALQQRHVRERARREGSAAVRSRRGILHRLTCIHKSVLTQLRTYRGCLVWFDSGTIPTKPNSLFWSPPHVRQGGSLR